MQTQAPRPRVLLAAAALDASGESIATMRRLARALDAELAGLFVEDVELLRLAALPFTFEIGQASGTVRAVELGDVERALHREAQRLRQHIQALGMELRRHIDFSILRGSLPHLALEADGDVLVIWPRAPARPRPGSIATLFDASAGGYRALDAALQVAEGCSERLVLVAHAESSDALQALRHAAANHLGGHGLLLRGLRVDTFDVATIRQVSEQLRPGTLVLARDALGPERSTLERLLAALHCPVVVVR